MRRKRQQRVYEYGLTRCFEFRCNDSGLPVYVAVVVRVNEHRHLGNLGLSAVEHTAGYFRLLVFALLRIAPSTVQIGN